MQILLKQQVLKLEERTILQQQKNDFLVTETAELVIETNDWKQLHRA